MRSFTKDCLAVALCVLCLVATLTGTTTHPTGAVVPGAKVTATNQGTSVPYTANTNEAGVYNLLFLPVGEYVLVTENQGFKKAQLGPFRLEVNQVARVDVQLEE